MDLSDYLLEVEVFVSEHVDLSIELLELGLVLAIDCLQVPALGLIKLCSTLFVS